ncbi:MAG: response regulator [Ruminococcus sp.]|nr:response regulator [Ruminococcus sp.]
MDLKQRQYNLLIVSAQPKFNESLAEMLGMRRYYEHSFEDSISSARRILNEQHFDMILINAPLPDEDGVRFAVDKSVGKCSVLLMVRNEYYPEIFMRVCPYGVYTLPKPPARQLVAQAFDWLESSCERLRKLEKRSVTLEDKMAEIRLVNRAKWLLISKEGLTEDEAHHRIEKLAMDKCVTKREIAEEILGVYGTTA